MPDKGPYRLLCHWQDGRVTVEAQGHNPVEVADAEFRIARNVSIIRRIELHDNIGCLESLWDASWELS